MGGQPLPVAVVGAGTMGLHHARNYHELPGADLRAVVDVDEERARLLADRFGCAAYSSLDELLGSQPDVVAASVAVPTSLHFDVTGTLLSEGRHVLVEKPIAATVAEAVELVAKAAAGGLVLAVGHVERFNPAVRALKQRIEDGEIGDVLSMVARRVGIMPPRVTDANVILDLAIHDVDIFRYLLEADGPDELYCNAGKARNGDRFDFADIFLRFGRVSCLLQVNWLTPVKIRSLAVTGTRAYGELEYVTQRLHCYPAQPIGVAESFAEVSSYSERPPERIELAHEEPLRRELEEFLRVVAGDEGEIVSGLDATGSLEIVDAILDSVDRRLEAASK